MKSISVKFPNKQGQTLAGILDLPKTPSAFAIYSHCFTCSKDIAAAFYICKRLASKNIAVLRFDFTGLGDSEGDFSETNFSTNVEDVIFAAKYLSSNHTSPKLLIGHSMGGTTSIAAAKKLSEIKAIVTIASPHKPSHVLSHFEDAKQQLIHSNETSIKIMEREFTIRKQLLDDIESYDNRTIIEDIKIPILIMHSPIDNIVSVQEASKLFMAAIHPKSFISLDGINHLVTEKEDAQYIANSIASWSRRYIG